MKVKPMEDKELLNELEKVSNDNVFIVKVYNLQISPINRNVDKRVSDLQAKYPAQKKLAVKMLKTDITNNISDFYNNVLSKVLEKLVKHNHFPFVVDGFEIAKISKFKEQPLEKSA